MQTLVPSFRRVVLNPREPSLKIALHLNLAREEREQRCKLLGVANVASVQLGELVEPFGSGTPGTLAALFVASEGQVLHLATGAPYAEPPPPATPVTPPATAPTPTPTPEESIAASVNSHDDVAAERDLWKTEAQGLGEQLEVAKAKLVVAVEDRNALVERLKVERERLSAATSKLDHLDKASLARSAPAAEPDAEPTW